MESEKSGITLRPYQLICAVCSLADKNSEKYDWLLNAVKQNPDLPLTLQCEAGEIFKYQDPGKSDSNSASTEYKLKRDLEILYKLNLFPGATLPARIVFNHLFDRIEDTIEICGNGKSNESNHPIWNSCPQAASGNYRKVKESGIEAIIPFKSEQKMKADKQKSLEAMYNSESVEVRPHILLCSVCQYGNGIRPPFNEDNLPELIALIIKKPKTRISLVSHAGWMMCAPCPYRVDACNGCVNNMGSGGLPNQLRDLRVLKKLGLSYGMTINAIELYSLMFKRISGTLEICGIEHSRPSVWWTGCGSATTNSESYETGKKLLITEFGIKDVL